MTAQIQTKFGSSRKNLVAKRASQKLSGVFFLVTLEHVKASMLVALMLLSTIATAQYTPPTVHDPSTVIRNTDGKYYTFTTHWGVGTIIATDPDFINYEYGPNAFADTSTYPGWIDQYVDNFDAYYWAPDVIKMNGYYYLYYSCSSMGAVKSAIGVARSTNLASPWTDLGMVVYSNENSNPKINAIDPGIFRDDDDKVWMVYGSYFDGIGIIELDSTTAKPKTGAQVTYLAGGGNMLIEAPYIIKNGGYYYLFATPGACCSGLNSTYYTIVGRSTSVTGPYTGWRTFLPNQDGTAVLGPGHIAYSGGRLTYHYYSKDHNGDPKLKVRTDFGFHNGWPYVGPPPSQLPVADGGVYRITPRHSGKALDVASCGTANGTNVQQWSWSNNDCQKWRFTDLGGGAWRISPLNAPSMALDLSSCSLSNAANIQLWTWADNDCQKWKLVERGSGYYAIQNILSGKVLDVLNFSTADGANVIQYANTSGSQNQEFSFAQALPVVNDGTYRITNQDSGMSWDSWGCTGNSGEQIAQATYLGLPCQKWQITNLGNGEYTIKSTITSKAVDVSSCSSSAGAILQLWTYWGGNCQKFKISYSADADGSYLITSVNGGRAVGVPQGSGAGTKLRLQDIANNQWQQWNLVSLSVGRIAAEKLVNGHEAISEMEVYPNPSEGRIHITTSGRGLLSVRISDLSGRTLRSFTITEKTEVDLEDLASGVYFMHMNDGKSNWNRRLVLK